MASTIVGTGPTENWRICFLVNAALLCTISLGIASNFANRLLRYRMPRADYDIVAWAFVAFNVIYASAVITASAVAWTRVASPESAIPLTIPLFVCVFLEPFYQLIVGRISKLCASSTLLSRFDSILRLSSNETQTWSRSLHVAVTECYKSIVHMNYAVLMLFIRKYKAT